MMSQMKSSSNAGIFRTYATHTLRYPWLFVIIVLAAVLAQVTVLAAPIYLKIFIDTLAAGDVAMVPVLRSTLAVLVLIWVLNWLFDRARYFATVYLEANVMPDLMRDAFSYLIDHSYNFFITQFAGSLTHRVSKFGRAYEVLFDSVIGNFLPTALFVIGAVAVLTSRNATLGMLLGVWIVFFLTFQIFVSRARKHSRVVRAAAETKVTAQLADAISNQSTIALFSGAEHEIARYTETVDSWRAATIRSWNADAWIWAGMGFFIIVIEAILLYGGIYYWERGLFTVGDFVLVQAYLFAAFERLAVVNRELRRVSDAISDAREMQGILDMPYDVADVAGAKKLKVTAGAIEFKDVSFAFPSDKSIFEHFNLSVKGGEKIALVGPSGAGKSTVIKLILRFFDVRSGAIEIDGQDIAAVTQKSLRNAISFVPQEPILFHRSLMENIRYGRRDASDADVMEAAKKAHCHDFISKLPQGYGTFVGERGVKLSGGERQRVAIARAILKNAPILILDEATSSLDSASEVLIQDALAQLMKGKTVIVIAHRLSTIMKMDRIVGLDGGRVVEQGTHQELLRTNGLYAGLWRHQAGGFILDEELVPLPVLVDGDIEEEDAGGAEDPRDPIEKTGL
jgi:ATP-binding cassette subfamily B protein